MNLISSLKDKRLQVTGLALAGTAFAFLVSADITGILIPSSDGTYEDWTRSPLNSTHYTAVDEGECNGTDDFVHRSGVGGRESYGVDLSSVPNGATITNIAIMPCASRKSGTGGGSSVLDVFYRWDGSDGADAGGYNLTGTTPVDLATTTFTGLSFSKTASSTLEIGIVFSSGDRGARVSRLATELTYITAPTAPSNLVATASSSSSANLNWTDNSSNEDGFKVERSLTSETGPFSQIATTSANVVSYNDTGLTSSTTYYYRVRAFNTLGGSNYSNTASTTTL